MSDTPAEGRCAEILLIEDNFGDVLLTKRAFKGASIPVNITAAEDGPMALAILRRQGKYASAPVPNLILLDLNLPKMSGSDVLCSIKADPQLRRIPVIVMTSSRAATDVLKSYDLHANAYILKPANLEGFAEAVRSIEQFWFSLALPAADGA